MNKHIVRKRNLRNDTIKPKRTFVGAIEYTEGLSKKIFKKENLNIEFRVSTKLFPLIRNDRYKLSDDYRNGIYSIPITKEDGSRSSYVGMTKRRMFIRKKEHMRDLRLGKNNSALAKLNLTENTVVHFNKMKIIAPYTTKNNTFIRESIEILFNKTKPINTELSHYIPRLWYNLLKPKSRIVNITNEEPNIDIDPNTEKPNLKESSKQISYITPNEEDNTTTIPKSLTIQSTTSKVNSPNQSEDGKQCATRYRSKKMCVITKKKGA